MKMKIINILLIVPMLVYCIGFLVYRLLEYIYSDEPEFSEDEEFMNEKILDKYQDLSREQQMEILHAVENMLDNLYYINNNNNNNNNT